MAEDNKQPVYGTRPVPQVNGVGHVLLTEKEKADRAKADEEFAAALRGLEDA